MHYRDRELEVKSGRALGFPRHSERVLRSVHRPSKLRPARERPSQHGLRQGHLLRRAGVPRAPLQTLPAPSGSNKNHRFMYFVRIIPGLSAVGSATFQLPPPLNPLRPHGELYDSCVDSIAKPQVFVVFDRDQCYPEFLIEYEAVADNVNTLTANSAPSSAPSNAATIPTQLRARLAALQQVVKAQQGAAAAAAVSRTPTSSGSVASVPVASSQPSAGSGAGSNLAGISLQSLIPQLKAALARSRQLLLLLLLLHPPPNQTLRVRVLRVLRVHRCQYPLGPSQLRCRQHPPISCLFNRWLPVALGRELAVPLLEMLLLYRPRLTTTRKVRRLCTHLRSSSLPRILRPLLQFLLRLRAAPPSLLPPQPTRHQLLFPHLPVEMRSIIVSLQQFLLSATTFQATQSLVCLPRPSFLQELLPHVPYQTLHNRLPPKHLSPGRPLAGLVCFKIQLF